MPIEHRTWRVARIAAGVVLAAVVVGLAVRPDTTLPLFWNVIVPTLPAVFLFNPLVWRNVCPLATANMLGNRLRLPGNPGPTFVQTAPAVGVVLLMTLVPARRFVFNENASALIATMLIVLAAAFALGSRYRVRSGFCNALCPVLPVERLYGQRSVVEIEADRCRPCTGCTETCIDQSPDRAPFRALGRQRDSRRWILTPFGAFAAAFPGFVFGFFQTADGGWDTAPTVYATILLWAGGSFGITTLVALGGGVTAGDVLPLLAAAASGAYYWYAVPGFATTLGLAETTMWALRFVALAGIGGWLLHARARKADTAPL